MKNICFLTGKLGGYEACRRMLKLFDEDPEFHLSIIVTDQHLYERFGRSITEVEKDFRSIFAVSMEQVGDTGAERAHVVGVCVKAVASKLVAIKPDVLILIGDRGESLAAATAALHMGIPIAHIQGGDWSGGIDQHIRDAITCMATWHFVSTPQARRRVSNLLGNNTIAALGSVFEVGDPHVDDVVAFCRNPNPSGPAGHTIFHYHPDSSDPDTCYERASEILTAVNGAGLDPLSVKPCSDVGYSGVIRALEELEHRHYSYLPRDEYINLMAGASLMIGNSSAALIEAPYLNLPAVNVGDRQAGRLHSNNVVHAKSGIGALPEAIRFALEKHNIYSKYDRPFGDGTANEKIYKSLRRTLLKEGD